MLSLVSTPTDRETDGRTPDRYITLYARRGQPKNSWLFSSKSQWQHASIMLGNNFHVSYSTEGQDRVRPPNVLKTIGKSFPYSLPSVGPGADPGIQAVSPQVTVSHPPGGRLPLLSARPAVTFLAAEHHRPLDGTKLYCLVIEAHRCALVSLKPSCVRILTLYYKMNIDHWPWYMTLTFNPRRTIVMTHTYTKVQRSVGSKESRDKRTDRQTLPIALCSRLTRSVNTYYGCKWPTVYDVPYSFFLHSKRWLGAPIGWA